MRRLIDGKSCYYAIFEDRYGWRKTLLIEGQPKYYQLEVHTMPILEEVYHDTTKYKKVLFKFEKILYDQIPLYTQA